MTASLQHRAGGLFTKGVLILAMKSHKNEVLGVVLHGVLLQRSEQLEKGENMVLEWRLGCEFTNHISRH
jgi:hypothetical protein